jgi:hypothetical protein
MAAREVVVQRQYAALVKILNVIEKHDSRAASELRRLTPGGAIPNSPRSLDETITFLAESVAALAGVVDALAKDAAPRRRGRPRKQDEK